ncbi:MAG: pyrroline-5-carboxylate reductase dimerization domain-containing protein, partial [Quisquiliibacterium sp.]
MADAILSAVGQTIWVEQESQIDAVTAVSGSGPAYVFYFMEAMHAGALATGLNEAHARQLTLATFAGASRLAEK